MHEKIAGKVNEEIVGKRRRSIAAALIYILKEGQ